MTALAEIPDMTRSPGSEISDAEHAEVVRLRKQLDELANLYAAGAITSAEWLTARQGIADRIEAHKHETHGQPRTLQLHNLPRDPEKLREYWTSLPLPQQRALLGAVISRVVVKPATRGGNRVGDDRIDIIWSH